MHAVVVAGDGLDVEVAESVNLQLECQSWLQVAVDGVLFKLLEEREEREKMARALWCAILLRWQFIEKWELCINFPQRTRKPLRISC